MAGVLKYCKRCREENIAPWYGFYPFMTEDAICSKHNIQMDTIKINEEDYFTILGTSHDPSFLEAMIKLKEDDIIEYNLKMSQFKAQLNTQQSNQHTQDNQIHCPYCHSTNVKKITNTAKVVNIAMFGLLGNKRKHEWRCNNCKSDF